MCSINWGFVVYYYIHAHTQRSRSGKVLYNNRSQKALCVSFQTVYMTDDGWAKFGANKRDLQHANEMKLPTVRDTGQQGGYQKRDRLKVAVCKAIERRGETAR